MNHDSYREWLDLEADGALDDAERSALGLHVAGCPDCAAERRRLAALVARLNADRVAVRPGFAAGVMASLAPAPWEARPAVAWRWPAAALVLLFAAAAGLLSIADLGAAGQGWHAVSAVADLLVAALAAGSGLLAASWTGVGAAIGEWLGASPANWLAAIALVGGLDFLAYRLLRSRRVREVASRRD